WFSETSLTTLVPGACLLPRINSSRRHSTACKVQSLRSIVAAQATMATVRYRDFEERTVNARDGARSVLEISLGAGLGHFHQCNGRARCTTCRVRVLKGAENLTPRVGEELQ